MIAKSCQKFLDFLGFDIHKFLFGFFEANTELILGKKLRSLDPDLKTLVITEDERMHYGDSELPEIASQNVVRSFSVDRIQYIRDCLGTQDVGYAVDLGDSNGLFIRSLQKTGISANISEQTVRSLKKKGLDAVRCDVEHLPFKDNSVDVFLCFQTLEHVKNPVAVLEEIGRACKKSLILSIPSVEKTRINRDHPDDKKPYYMHHIFEFSPSDFRNVVKLTPFALKSEKTATVIDGSASLFHWPVFSFWDTFVDRDTYCSCFKKFYMCHLVKKERFLP